jgi:benzoate-CoA ligase
MENQYKDRKCVSQDYNIASKLIDAMVEKGFGDKIAVYYKDKTYTYREMQSMINRVGNALHLLGVHMEERVMLVMYDSPEAMASFYATIKIGAIPILVNYMCMGDDFCFLLNDSRARTLIAHEDFVEEIDGWREKMHFLENTIILGNKTKSYQVGFHDIVDHCSDQLQAVNTSHKDIEIRNYTSGITGDPKAAIHFEHDVFTCLESYAKGILKFNQSDILLSASKFFVAYGLGNSFIYPPGVGGSVVLLPDRPLPETIFDTITKYKPTVFFGVPTLYANMLQTKDAEKKYDLSSLRICASAGEALPKNIFFEWKKRFGQEILDGIGSTELMHIFISNRPGDVKPGSSGKIVPGYTAKIVDENGNEVPEGEVGNLQVKDESMATSYARQRDKTKTSKASMPMEWFNTRDWYYRDAEGYYYYYGRVDDMSELGSTRMSQIEIENTLVSHPAVLETAVVAKEDEHGLVKPKAYVVLKSGFEPSEELAIHIQDYAKKGIASYKYPQWIEFTKELPKTPTSKVQRYKLWSEVCEKKKMPAK